MSFEPGLPDIRIIIREAADENLTVDVPNIVVKVQQGDQYNVNVNSNTVTPIRTGSFTTYADFAGIAATASYVSGASVFATTASFALTASYVSGAASNWDSISNKPTGIVSSSTQVLNYNIFATTGSNTFVGNQTITGSLDVDGTINVTSISSSLYGTSSVAVSSSFALTASYVSGAASTWDEVSNKPIGLVSSSLQINTGSFTGSFTGSLLGTSSYANNALSSSFATSASRAITASYALNSDLLDGINSTTFATTGSNTFVGNQTVSGSILTNADTLILTGSMFVSGTLFVSNTITGSLFGTASVATTSSYALTASYIDGGYY